MTDSTIRPDSRQKDTSTPDEPVTTLAPQEAHSMPLIEFVALMALMAAVTALSIDAMLPALGIMSAELSPDHVNRAQLVLSVFAIGMGVGTILAGSISDWLGRKRTITIGFGIYIVSAIAAAFAPTLDTLLAARFVMGFAAAGPRIASVALIRDLYAGREMARIVSFVMMVFMIVPAAAPAMGELVMNLTGSWRMIFMSFVVFGLGAALWLNLRQPETLPVEARRPLTLSSMVQGVREVLSDRQIALCAIAMTFGFGQMFSMLMSSKQLYTETYGQGANFTKWFALTAVLSTLGTFTNARLVMKLGMRRIIRWTFAAQTISSVLFLTILLTGRLEGNAAFALFFIWSVGLMSVAGLTFGNLNALAMQQRGDIAGLVASVIAAISTVFGGLIASTVGLAYNGTAIPLAIGSMVCSVLALLVVRRLG